MTKKPPQNLSTFMKIESLTGGEINSHTTMSFADFITATQADVKGRIEDECRKQMLVLLDESFAKHWAEYRNKAIQSALETPQYTANYGRLDVGSIPETADITSEIKNCIKTKLAAHEFPSENVYFIHCCVKMNYGYSYSKTMEVQLIDNHGFSYGASVSVSSGSYGQPNVSIMSDITKTQSKEQYVFPLPNVIIDIIKSTPYSIEARRPEVMHMNDRSGGDFNTIIHFLPHLRKIAEGFSETAVAFESLKKENMMLKARVAEMETAASSNTPTSL
jgi:hypothetical protein